MRYLKYIFCIILLVVAYSCRKPYLPPVVATSNSYLVVEGVINAGSDSTIIKISRTVKLADSVGLHPEQGASVSVEGGGTNAALTEIRPGVYFVNALNLNITGKYHLHIRTANSQEYLSDDQEIKVTPPIDTITYQAQADKLVINATAHDPANNTHYYRWDFSETWRFHTKFESNFKVSGADVVARTINDQIYYCFAGDQSSSVVLSNSLKLAQDIVADVPITQIPATSEKLGVRYSILLNQYALTREGYEFWDNLKKNTEQLGSIFDALPSQISGNIHNTTNPKEPVIGYISVSTVQHKRIFIDNSEVPRSYQVKYPYDCQQDTALYHSPTNGDQVATSILTGLYFPTSAITNPTGTIIGFKRSSRECVDCTVRGAKQQPAFWK